MKAPTILLLIVGCVWTLFVIWLFLAIAGVAGPPESIMKVVFYWGSMLVGPIILIAGAVILLRQKSSQLGFLLAVMGCVILSVLVLYNGVAEMLRTPHALEANPPYFFYIALLFIMLISDAAVYKIFRARRRFR